MRNHRRLSISIPLLLLLSLCVLLPGTDAAQEQAPAEPDTRPAGEVYQNIQIFQQMPVYRFDALMDRLNVLLGVECTHCHVKDAWEREDVEAKQTARRMFRMVGAIRQDYFEGEGGPTCWTCHRGSIKPEQGPPDEVRAQLKEAAVPEPSPFEADTRPSGEVYMNIQVFQQVPADKLENIMKGFTRWLGVECSHCHVPGQWYSDKKDEKKMARRMLQMRADINQDYFDGKPRIGCWTCHRGSHEPATKPPPAS
jgi:hypothetical protein